MDAACSYMIGQGVALEGKALHSWFVSRKDPGT